MIFVFGLFIFVTVFFLLEIVSVFFYKKDDFHPIAKFNISISIVSWLVSTLLLLIYGKTNDDFIFNDLEFQILITVFLWMFAYLGYYCLNLIDIICEKFHLNLLGSYFLKGSFVVGLYFLLSEEMLLRSFMRQYLIWSFSGTIGTLTFFHIIKFSNELNYEKS